jgi:GNAT superfamily N-acetyltransferase
MGQLEPVKECLNLTLTWYKVLKAMNKRHAYLHVLLIRSPFTIFSGAFRDWAHRVLAGPSANRRYHICDAASDYVKQVLMQVETLIPLIEAAPPLMKHKSSVGAKQRAVQKGLDTISAFAVDPHRGDRILELAGPGGADLHGTNTLLEDLTFLDTVLDLVSTAYAPCRMHRHGFSHDGLNDADALIDFSKQPRGNPFYHYAYQIWQPLERERRPDAALLHAAAPGQMGPAVTLAAAWRARWPEIPIQLVGPDASGPELEEVFCRNAGQAPSMEKVLAADIEKINHGFSTPPNRGRLSADFTAHWMEETPGALAAGQMPAVIGEAVEKERRLITWEASGGPVEDVTRQLYAVSRHGIWNHVIFTRDTSSALKKFAAANANIVHSYCHRQDKPSVFSDPVFKYPDRSAVYGHTRVLPGRPLWMALKDGLLIRAMLDRYGMGSLMRLRVRQGGRGLFEAGQNLSYHYQRPDELPDGHLDEIVRMVEAGGSINTQFVRHNLERAYLVAYVEEEGVIVGNSSLKHPRKEYIDAVSRQSGIDLHHFLERGYTSVRPEYRGLGVGAKLLEGLTQRAGAYKIFSVIAEGNIATQKMAIRNRTRRVATFFSRKVEHQVGVWIPEWMLPEGIVPLPQPRPHADDVTGKDTA